MDLAGRPEAARASDDGAALTFAVEALDDVTLDISQPELMDEKALGITQSDGLRTYDLIEWETRFWQQQIGKTLSGDPIYRAPIDTTFAVYNKRYFRRETHLAAVRFGGRYTCRHLPWYKDNGLDAAEDRYYREHQEWSTFLK